MTEEKFLQQRSSPENMIITIQIIQLIKKNMGLFELFGIPSAVAPTSSFAELIDSLRRNREDEKEQSEEDGVIEDNKEEQL